MTGTGGIETRRFAAGRAAFVVRCPSAEVRDAVEALFVDLRSPLPDVPATQVVLTTNESGDLSLEFGGDRPIGPQRPNGALATLVTKVSRLALDMDAGRLHLHCAALALNGRGVLISAASGTGKTTLAASLLQHGWTYVSDEAVSFEAGSSTAVGFAKPLMIKPGGGLLLPALASARVSLEPHDDQWHHVPASVIPAPIEPETEPVAIVILHRSLDGSTSAPPVVAPLHPADAIVALLGQTMDPMRFGSDATAVLADLATRCRCVTLSVGPLDAAVEALEFLLRSGPTRHGCRELLARPDVNMGWDVPPAVRSFVVGERAVVHDTSGGAIVALDEAGTAVWCALHGDPPDWWSPETIATPGTVAFLAQLVDHRLLNRSESTEAASR